MSATSQRGRRDERITAAHEAATSPAGWFCRVEGCPIEGERQPAASYDAAVGLADAHYNGVHFVKDWRPGMAAVRI